MAEGSARLVARDVVGCSSSGLKLVLAMGILALRGRSSQASSSPGPGQVEATIVAVV